MDLLRGAKELNCLERAMNRFAEDTLCIDTIRRGNALFGVGVEKTCQGIA